MNTMKKKINDKKEYTSPDLSTGVKKLYFLAVEEKPGMIKVGDTRRDVETRNNETILNASLHITDRTWYKAEMWDGTEYYDKKFHRFLEDKGYVRELNNNGTKSEWFLDVTFEQLFNELELFTKKPVYKTVELRKGQNYVLDQIQSAFDNGEQYINAGLCVRVGKTIISLTAAANNNCMPVYLGKNLTSQKSAEKDNAEFGIVPEMLVQSLHGDNDEELKDNEISKKTKTVIANIKKANKNNKDIIFFVDEVDDQSHTEKTTNIITPVVEHFKRNKKFRAIITMSGTRIHRGMKVLSKLTNGDIKEISLEYYEMQILQPETTCKRNFRNISFYSEAKTGLVNISDAMKNKKKGQNSLATVITELLGANNFNFTTNDLFPHWFMKFATVGRDNANDLVKYLNGNCSTVENKEYLYAEINGSVTNSKQAEKYCKKIIADNPTKTCVFITQGMATTSFSVSSIGNTVVFTDNEITADDTQALHRSATWVEGKDDCNMILVTTNDSKEHQFDDIFEDEMKEAVTREDKIELYKEILDLNSVAHYSVNGDSMVPVAVTEQNAELVLDKKAKAMTQIASLVRSITDTLDEDVLETILLTVEGVKGTSVKFASTKGKEHDIFNQGKKKAVKRETDKVSIAQKEKILRAFIEGSINVPALARVTGTAIESFEEWVELGISKELFFDVYNTTPSFKDRIDTIYGLCDDNNYLHENYINKLAI